MNRFFKAFIFASIFCPLSIATINEANANSMDRLVTSLCEAAQNDDRRGMRKKLDIARLRLNNIYESVQCGSHGSLLRVATTSGSMDAAKFITTKIKKSALTEPESDGKSIIEFSQALVASGDSSKQAFVDLFQSKI